MPVDFTPEAHTDSTLALKVASRLRSSGYLPLRDLHVTVATDAIVLGGTLPSFYLKQLAQVVAKSVEGVVRVSNDTIVNREPATSQDI